MRYGGGRDRGRDTNRRIDREGKRAEREMHPLIGETTTHRVKR
jgi:hypothetical protein